MEKVKIALDLYKKLDLGDIKPRKNVTDSELIMLMNVLCPYWCEVEKEVIPKIDKTDIERYAYELKIWRLGAIIGYCMHEQKRQREVTPVLDTAIEILKNRNYRNGRVSFVFLFIDFGVPSYDYIFKDIIFDNDTQLQLVIVEYIRKRKALDLKNEVEKLLASTFNVTVKKQCEKCLKTINRNMIIE